MLVFYLLSAWSISPTASYSLNCFVLGMWGSIHCISLLHDSLPFSLFLLRQRLSVDIRHALIQIQKLVFPPHRSISLGVGTALYANAAPATDAQMNDFCSQTHNRWTLLLATWLRLLSDLPVSDILDNTIHCICCSCFSKPISQTVFFVFYFTKSWQNTVDSDVRIQCSISLLLKAVFKIMPKKP